MKKDDDISRQTAELRRRAEEIARRNVAQLPGNLEALGPEETRQMFHELQVHQIELEMHNEELRRAQAELEALRARYFDLYDRAPVSYCTLSEKGLILEANLTTVSLLGVPRAKLVNQPITRFIPPESQDIYYRHHRQLLKTGEAQTCELRMARKDGTQFWAHLEATVTEDADGLPVSRVVISDITDRKLAEEALRGAHDVLELRVQERTAELKQETRGREQAQRQLIRAQKLEALGVLSGGIAHDFNNILAGIIGFTEMALEDLSPDSPEHRRLGLVLKGAHRGRDLVKQILVFSRRSEHDKKPLVLSQIIDEVLKLLRPAFPSTIEIVWKYPIDDDRTLADPVQMHQVLMNLCTNAAHAMRQHGGTLAIGISRAVIAEGTPLPVAAMVPGEYVVLKVSDTGCGMESETLERIFDPFFTTKREGEGTGLGLSVSYGIVKSHGGYIAVKSEPGKGSTFEVYLPKVSTAAVIRDEEAPSVARGNERILIVDDEDTLVELNRQRLTRLGYDVVATTSSMEALHIFREGPDAFDLVITDQTMPNLTGMDLATELLKVRPDIPIILCTGHSDAVSPDSIQKAGIKALLMKPLNKRGMAEAVRLALDSKEETMTG